MGGEKQARNKANKAGATANGQSSYLCGTDGGKQSKVASKDEITNYLLRQSNGLINPDQTCRHVFLFSGGV